jgi:autotransporter-associated beta strand protein
MPGGKKFRKMRIRCRNAPWASYCALVALLLALPRAAESQIYTFTENSGTSWTTPENWTENGTVPASAPGLGNNGTALFDTASTATLPEDVVLDGLDFEAGARIFTDGNADRTISLGTGGLTVNSTSAPVVGNATADQRVTFFLTGNQVWNISGADWTMNTANTVDANTRAVEVNASSNLAITGNLSGSGPLTKNGTGTLIISGNNADSFTGNVTILSGTLQLGNNGASGSISASSSVVNDGTLTINRSDTSTFSNSISGSGSFVTAGSGTLTLNGTNTYTGGTTISAGTLTLGGGSAIPDASATTVNATLNLGGFNETIGLLSGSSGGAIQLGSQTLTVNQAGSDSSFAGAIHGTGTFVKAGGRALTLSGNNSGFSGNFSLNGGTLAFPSPGAFGAAQGINIASGTLSLTNSATQAFGKNATISGSSTIRGASAAGGAVHSMGNLSIGQNTLTVDRTGTGTYRLLFENTALSGNATFSIAASTTLTLNGSVSGSFGLSKTGIGTLSFNGANAYTGSTTLSAGTLHLAAGSTTSSAITLNGTAANAPTLIGNGTASTSAIFLANSTISPGDSPGSIGTLTIANLTLRGNTTYTWNFSNATAAPGTGWDLVSTTDTTVSANSTARTTIDINGSPSGWDSGLGWSGTIIGIGSGSNATFQGTDPVDSRFAFDLSGFSGGLAGSWSINSTAGAIRLVYSPSPVSNWSGGAGNWSTGFPSTPSDGDLLVFSGAGGTSTNNIASGNLSTVTGITFNSTAGAYTLDADTGSSGSGAASRLAVGGDITNSSGSAQLVALALSTNGAISINSANATGSLVFSGGIANNSALRLQGNGATTFSGNLTGTGTATKSGAGTLFITAQSFTNNLTVTGGNVTVGNGSSAGSLPASVALNNSTSRILFHQDDNSTYAGTIGGNGSFTKNGSGTLTLNASQTYTGNTTINNGTLAIGPAGSLGGGSYSGSISNTGTLVYSGAASQTFGGNISGVGSLAAHAGTLILTANNTSFSGPASILSGATLQIGNNGTTGNLSASSGISNNGTLIVNRTGSITLNNTISGNGALTKNGTGTLILTGGNTYTGATTIAGGILQLGNNGTTGSVSAWSNFLNNGTLTINRSDPHTFSNSISGNGSFIKAGSGNLTLNGTNTYTGGTTISAGTLTLSGGSAIPDSSATSVNATLSVADSETIGTLSGNSSGALGLGSQTLTVNQAAAGTYAGTITGSGGFAKSGADTLTLTANSTFTGTVSISSGTLQLGNNGASGNFSASASFANSGTLTVNRSDSFTLANSISGSGSFVKAGSGALTLNGAAYTGTTTVSAGTLRVDGSLATSGATIQSGATFSGNATLAGLVTLNSGATISPGSGIGSTGTMSLNGGLSLNSGSTVRMDVFSTNGSSDRIAVEGSLQNAGSLVLETTQSMPGGSFTNNYTLFTASSFSGNWTSVSVNGTYTGSFSSAVSGIWTRNTGDGTLWSYNQNSGILTVVPEPSVAALLGCGAAFLAWRRLRKRRA